jgi:hypothetical protein
MRTVGYGAISLALLLSAHSAGAHGIAGNRFFVGTLTFDDPSVADEAIIPDFSTLKGPVEGGNATEDRFDWSFTRMLTPFLQVQVDSGWIRQNWPTARTTGFATTDVGIKSEIYRNDQHEMLVAAGLLWGIGHSGSQAVGAEPNSIQPGVFFGKGFGNPMGSRGFGLWPSPAHSWTNCLSARPPPRLA